ncbi:MarR family winged helix-turn-helix transcriptional regulator [Hoeflea sp.]|uniref:MarR family winged helix-turn-helix transcriptional regulator n=1 Tax=Hoeflea sp. TaxID=1940281 RepID=UPI003B0165FF
MDSKTADATDAHYSIDAVDTLTFRLIVLGNKIASSFNADFGRKHGIILSEWRCIIWLAARPGSSGQETSHGTAMDRMSVSRSLRSLEQKNMVKRRTDENDAKRWLWTLTPAGRAVYDAIMPHAEKRDRLITGAFNAAELKSFSRAISKAMKALD